MTFRPGDVTYHAGMKRLPVLLCALLLAGCGSLSTTPTTGQLLDAPTTLNVAGKPVKTQATPTVNGNIFSVKIKLSTTRAVLPALKLKDVYVVTQDGVWTANTPRNSQWKCAPNCALAVVRGPANGLQRGMGVQIVLGLQDAQGRTLLLRDAQATVK